MRLVLVTIESVGAKIHVLRNLFFCYQLELGISFLWIRKFMSLKTRNCFIFAVSSRNRRENWVLRISSFRSHRSRDVPSLKVAQEQVPFQIRMSKTPAKVSEFLTSLASKLKPLWDKEKLKMLELKQEEVCSQRNIRPSNRLLLT